MRLLHLAAQQPWITACNLVMKQAKVGALNLYFNLDHEAFQSHLVMGCSCASSCSEGNASKQR